MTALLAAAVLLLLAGAATLAAAEAAAFQLGSSRLRTLLDEGFQGSDALARVRSEPGEVRAAVRVAWSALVLTAVGLSTAAGALAWGWPGAVLDLAAGLVLVVVLVEVTPRALAGRHPVRLALAAAPLLLALGRGLRPLTAPLARLEAALVGRSGEEDAGERELRDLQEVGTEEGVLGPDENLLVERAFRLDELTAWDVMTPRVDIFAWDEARTLEEIRDALPEVPYSRVPIYRDSVDDVTGIVYVREAYQALLDGAGDRTLATLARTPFFVPGSLSLSRLLQDFQARRIHMGIVADEFGGVDGLVTLEDVLEELVGEIVDETDVAEEPLVRLSRSELLADGGVDVRDVNDAFNVALPMAEHRSLNGFILEELGYVPPPGERLERGGVRIEILESTETQVLRARLTRLAAAGEPPPPS